MQLQQAELLAMGFNIMTDPVRLTFSYNQNNIVQDVESGYADVGLVRTDMIDRSVAEGTTRWENFRLINEIPDSDFPFKRSTSFTPEWPIGALTHVPNEMLEVVATSLWALDRDSTDPALATPGITGEFATWVPPMNYLGLLGMLESIGYYNPKERNCLRSEDVYEAVQCPSGYVKQSSEKAFCIDDCKDGYTCLCRPCTKLQEPALMLQARALETTWPPTVDTDEVQALEPHFEKHCKRMDRCLQVATGQRVRWTLLDQIGSVGRAQINAPMLDEVKIRLRFDADWQPMVKRSATLPSGLSSEEYIFDDAAGTVGTHVVEVMINGEQAVMSPVVTVHTEPPQKVISCPEGQRSEDDGSCTPCPPGTVGFVEGVKHSCRPCMPGLYQPSSSKMMCVLCPSGRGAALDGATECEACAAGSSTMGREGRVQCEPCEPGQEAVAPGQERCSSCPRGTYSLDEGSSECITCDSGTTTRELGSRNASACGCSAGNYLLKTAGGQGQCQACQTPSFICAGFGAEPVIVAGYMSLVDEPLKAFACLEPEHCPGGGPGRCAAHRDASSVACGDCAAGSYEGSGKCQPCQEYQSWKLALVLLAVVIVMVPVALASMKFVNREDFFMTHSSTDVAVLVSMSVSVLQAFTTFGMLSITWFEPVASLFKALGALSLNLQILRVSCVVTIGPVASFILDLCPILACAGIAFGSLLIKKVRKPGTDFMAQYVNTMGALGSMFFISIVLGCMQPFICYSHPGRNGMSMRSRPSVLCFDSKSHTLMSAVGIVALGLVPLPLVALACYSTRKYPLMIVRSESHRLLTATRFLFLKFKEEKYFYGIVLMAKSLLICLVPVAFRDRGQVQVVIMTSMLCVFVQVQQELRPWHSNVTNTVDGLIGILMTVVLVSGALESDYTAMAQASVLPIIGTVALVLIAVLAVVAIVRAIYRHFRVWPYFHHFVTHHKADAAAQARLLKMLIDTAYNQNTFIDSDHLKDLDTLFDTVKTRVGQLIVLLTRDTLKRPWCAGEIATAYKCNLEVLVMEGPSFYTPTVDELGAQLNTYIDVSGVQLSKYGIHLSDIREAYHWMLSEAVPSLALCADEAPRVRLEQAVACLKNLSSFSTISGNSSVMRVMSTNSSGTRTPKDWHDHLKRSGLVVLSADPNDDEAGAAAGIIIVKLQAKLGHMGSGLHMLHEGVYEEPADQRRLIELSRALVVLLTARTLSSKPQLDAIIDGMSAKETGSQLVVIPLSTPSFTFPSETFLATSLPAEFYTKPDADLAQIKGLFRFIASAFTFHASNDVIQLQTDAILDRIPAHFDKHGGRRIRQLSISNKISMARTNSLASNELESTQSSDLESPLVPLDEDDVN
mmetsp:Transcript_135156/g.431494  ORF Transcript_135156/g.431494 Transcript_135156/m.431494 type:complete len:1353 (-) Transcript_135156:426-4484(-)